MIKKIAYVSAWIAFGLALVVLVIYLIALSRIPSQQQFSHYGLVEGMKTLEQNWSQDIRQQMHFVSFGSRMMPYSLFLALEQPDSKELFRANTHMRDLGFILQKATENNPDALPIGFSKDETAHAEPWVGLTCAACHTGSLSYQGTTILLDGGPGFLDFQRMEARLLASLTQTLQNEQKLQRTASRMGVKASEVTAIIKEREWYFSELHRINKTDVAYGHARLDAFGRIFNAVSSEALKLPENYHTPDAPVSIPMLWSASHLDVVQWNASAPNKNPGPLGQNVTTALAVYGDITIEAGSWGYSSSVNIPNLGYIQKHFYKLMSPVWPQDILGELNSERVARGEALYRENCVSCHELIDRSDKKVKLTAKIVPQNQVGTDPTMTVNFAQSMSKTGPLQGQKSIVLFGKPLPESTHTLDLVINAAVGAVFKEPINSLSAFVAEQADVGNAVPDLAKEVYKARALNGIWATGPFLHNGSVPNLWALLQAVENRPKEFYVKSREFDPVNVGFVSTEHEGASFYDTQLKGNSNEGHVYGTGLSEAEKYDLLEFLKSL